MNLCLHYVRGAQLLWHRTAEEIYDDADVPDVPWTGFFQVAPGNKQSKRLAQSHPVIAGVKEAGWEPEDGALPAYRLSIDRVMLPPTQENLHTLMQDAWQALHAHEDSWPFREPVDPDDVPDYFDVIKVVLCNNGVESGLVLRSCSVQCPGQVGPGESCFTCSTTERLEDWR
jgi:hypothetical protein